MIVSEFAANHTRFDQEATMSPLRLASRLVLVLTLLTSATVFAKSAVVILNDGRHIEGELVAETADTVTVKVSGIPTPFSRDQIAEIQYPEGLEEQYRKRRAALEDDDYSGRYELSRWLYDQGRQNPLGYRLAKEELDSLLKDHPGDRQALVLRNMVVPRVQLLEADKQPEPTRDRPRRDQPADQAEDQEGEKKPKGPQLLTQEQTNLMKVFEIELDTEPRVVVPDNVINELFGKFRTTLAELRPELIDRNGRGKFRRMPGHKQLRILFQVGSRNPAARRLYKEVVVRDEPQSLQTFRTSVNPKYVARYCGQCHGEGKEPGLYVFTLRAAAEQPAYTNLLILNRMKSGDGRMIDRDRHADSLLLEYGLPQDVAVHPHPEVQGWRPFFNNGREDPKYRAYEQWIAMLYGRNNFRYPINYEAPKPAPSPESESGEGEAAEGEAAGEGGG